MSVLELGHRLWRRLPREFRRRSMSGLAARLAARPDWPPPAQSRGVVVAGDLEGANGLAESARLLYRVIAGQGLARGTAPLGLPSVVPRPSAPLPPDAALLAVVNAPLLPVGLLRHRRDLLKHRRVIGMWAWELPVLPAAWHYGAGFVHEVWAPSEFTAAAVSVLLPGRVRVVPYPLAAVPLPVEGGRADFGLEPDRLVVLVAFNLASSMERKNPLGHIAAFRAAFGASPDHLLVVKVTGAAAYPEDLRRIAAAVGDAPNIRLLNETFSEPKLRGLIAASDIVLSLHRSEGFGLIPAAAMLLGRPVVATGWSGNLTFMTPEVSALVGYRLIPAEDARGNYAVPKAVWAEPDVEEAADWLRRLAADAGLRARLGAAAQAHAQAVLGAGPVMAALAANGIV